MATSWGFESPRPHQPMLAKRVKAAAPKPLGEGGGHGVAHLGATVQPEAKRQQRGRGGGAQMQVGTGDANDHASFGKATVLRLRKAGADDRIEALPKHSRSPKE